MLNNGELFQSQEAEGDQIRRERATPEPEFVPSVIRYVRIYESKHNGERWPGRSLYDTYDDAANTGAYIGGVRVTAVRAVRIDL